MMAKIIEIFSSIQGEGKYAGTRQVFVRFFECNMHCVWCDTPHSIGDTTRNYREVSLEEVVAGIENVRAGSDAVSLTGGEPLLQAGFIQELIPHLKKNRLAIHLETNGVLPEALAQVIEGVDVVAMDLKLPSSTQCRPYWEEHARFLDIARQKDVFIKTVVSSQTSVEDVQRAADLVAKVAPDTLFILQPNTFDLGNGVVKKCVDFQAMCSQRLRDVRVIPQLHKFMKVR